MAIAFRTSFFSGGAASGTSASVGPFTATATDLIVLLVACKPTSATVSTITDTAGNTYASCGAGSVDTSNYRTEVFYAKNCLGAASNTVTVTMSGTVTDLNLAVLEYSGAAANVPFDVAVTSTGSGTLLTSGTFTPNTSGETAVLFGVCTNAVTGFTAGANYTSRDSGLGSAGFLGGEDRIGAPSGAQTGTFTANASGTWQCVVAVFSPTDLPVGTTYNESVTEDGHADVLLDVYGPIRYLAGTAFQPNAFEDAAFQVFGGVTGGGNSYNESVTETALAQESLKTVQGFAQPFAENAQATDILKSVQGMLAVLQEQALAQDAEKAAQGFPAGLAESALAQGSDLAVQGIAQGIAEQALAQESTTTVQGMAQGTSETALAQEATKTAQGMNAAFSESSQSADVLASSQSMLASLSENALAQETSLTAIGFAVGLSEQSLADVLIDNTYFPGVAGGAHIYNEGVSEQALAQDLLNTVQFMLSSFAEAAAAQDILATAQGMPSSISESATAQDAVANSPAYAVTLAERALAQESTFTAQGFAQGLGESALAQDVVLAVQGLAQPFAESALAQELINAADGMNLRLSEAATADVLLDSTLFKGGVPQAVSAVFVFDD